MKFFHNNHHIKTIPAHFASIENLECYIDDLEKKRLSKTERQQLNAVLMRERMNEFVQQIFEDKVLNEHVQKAHPLKAALVQPRTCTYYVIVFSDKTEVRCDYRTYQSAPVKTNIRRLY